MAWNEDLEVRNEGGTEVVRVDIALADIKKMVALRMSVSRVITNARDLLADSPGDEPGSERDEAIINAMGELTQIRNVLDSIAQSVVNAGHQLGLPDGVRQLP